MVPFNNCEGPSVPCPFPRFRWFAENLGDSLACISTSASISHGVLPEPVSVPQFPLFYKLYWIGAHASPV